MPLPVDWGKYLGGGDAMTGARGMTGTTQEGWDQALNWARSFDPNAAIRANENGQEGQYISFNNALAPVNAMGGKGIHNATNLAGLADQRHYTGPRAQDSGLGEIGFSPLAQRQLTDRGTWLDIVGPMLVGASIGGFPMLASALSGGALGGAAGSLGMVGNAMTKAPRFLSGMSNAGVFGGGGPDQMSPEMMALLRMLSANGGG